MKISGRNFIAGKIVDVHKGSTTAHVTLEVAPGIIITASITNEAVDELKLTKGRPAHALIKSSDVMIAVDESQDAPKKAPAKAAAKTVPAKTMPAKASPRRG